MKRAWEQRYVLAAVIAMAASQLIADGSRARAQEPGEWCDTYEHWVAKAGAHGGVAAGGCQTFSTCDTPPVRDSWIPGPSTPIVTIRIKFHVFCETDGTNCAASPSDVAAQMTQLNLDYAPYRIQFTESTQAEYINDSAYRYLDESEVNPMKNTYADDPAEQVNVYVADLAGGWLGRGTFPWDPDAIGNTGGVIMDETRFGAGEQVLTHELGHNLGLWHTQHGVSEVPQCSACYERADGVDGDITGDFASDTPPTPTNDSCNEVSGDDPCSVPPTPWAATQPENYMSYGELFDETCWTLFTSQQAGRKHCWIDDVLTGWIGCTTNEVPGSTCRDGIDNDCDGLLDCEDVADCGSDLGCNCYDDGAGSPLVCVDWPGQDPPDLLTDFVVYFERDAANPDVEFRTGSNAWRVWSQVSVTDATPANLGHIGIDPTLPTDNFSVTLAHGESAGAANVASIALVDEGWTAQSNLVDSRIGGDLMGDLVLQEDSAGQGGVASFIIGSGVYGDVTIPRVDTLGVGGMVGPDAMITISEMVGDKIVMFTGAGEFAGDLYFENGLPSDAGLQIYGLLTDTASVDFNGQALAGYFFLWGGSEEYSVIAVGPLTGTINLFSEEYLGSATFASIEPTGLIAVADLSGSINVPGDWKGGLNLISGDFPPGESISIGGELSATGWLYFDFVTVPGGVLGGDVLIGQDCDGLIIVEGNLAGDISVNRHISGLVDIAGDVATTGQILADADTYEDGDITGDVTVHGVFDGNICGDNLAPEHAVPPNIDVTFGPNGTVCGAVPCLVADAPEAEVLELLPGDPENVKNRYLSVTAGTPGRDQAIRVTTFSLPVPFHIWNGQEFYAGEPRAVCENAGNGWNVGPNLDVPGVSASPCGPSLDVYENGQDYFWAAPLVCDSAEAHFMDWGTLADHCNTPGAAALDGYPCSVDADCQDAGNPNGTCGVSDVVHLYHEGVVPSHMVAGAGPIGDPPVGPARYRIQAIDSDCMMTDEANYSPAMPMTQAGWGDVVLNVAECPNGPPEETVDVITDVVALLNKFSNLPCAIQKARADLVPCLVDASIGIPDVVASLGAFGGADYEDSCGSGQCSAVGLCKGGPDHGLPCTTDNDCNSDVCASEGEAAAGGGATGGSTPTPGATAALTLTTSHAAVKMDETVDVHVFASGIKDLRAYEVKLNVDGGTDGELTLADLRIDTDRDDYVFSGLKEVHATDLSGSRIGGALVSGAIDAVAPVYLGTYTFQTSARAAGVFGVSVEMGNGTPILMDSKGTPVPFAPPSALQVTIGE